MLSLKNESYASSGRGAAPPGGARENQDELLICSTKCVHLWTQNNIMSKLDELPETRSLPSRGEARCM